MSKVKCPAFVRDGVGIIRLTQGYESIVDVDILDWAGVRNWCIDGKTKNKSDTQPRYAIAWDSETRKMVQLHREVFRYRGIDIAEGMEVDHINRNSLDNRFENLRVVTHSMNIRNCDRFDKAKGVNFRNEKRRKKKYHAIIKVEGKEISLGYYLTEKEAHEVYIKEAKRLGRHYE